MKYFILIAAFIVFAFFLASFQSKDDFFNYYLSKSPAHEEKLQKYYSNQPQSIFEKRKKQSRG